MVIDFHTHIFPDKLAGRALLTLTSNGNDRYTPVHNATLSGLLANMDASGVDQSVILPVITKQSQTKATNEWAASLASERIIPFGGLYPHSDDYKRDIDDVVGLGLRGIKLHPEYQDFTLDSSHMLKIYDYALSRGLILLIHAGYDPAFPPPFRSSPRQFANVARAMGGGVVVAAHLGGHDQWDDVENELAGEDIYLDTSMGFAYYPRDQFLRIVAKHGADKILFATDSPWSNPEHEIKRLLEMPLSNEEKDAIFSGNARRILGLEQRNDNLY